MVENLEILFWVQNWFYNNCDGEWEHNENFTIRTLDNPGWSLEVNIEGTNLELKEFKNLRIDKSEYDWYHCFIRDGRFHAAGGPKNLVDILRRFKNWAT